MSVTIKLRKGSSSEWASNSSIVLGSGEPGFELDTGRLKIGNGTSTWANLDYASIIPTGFIAGSGIDIDLGTNGSTATIGVSGSFVAENGTFDIIQFNTDNGQVDTQGQIGWNDTDGTVDVALTDTAIVHIGEHTLYRIRNTTGDVLYKGQAVYASGIHSNGIITPDLYVADGSIREIRFMGLVFEDVNHNNNGYVINFGHIYNIDTRGNVPTDYAVGDETWLDGDILYVHPTVAGKLTKNEPKHSISAAIILDAASNGKIFVRPTSYGHLDDNHDVNTSGVVNGQFLQYDSSIDYWIPSSSGNFTSLEVNSIPVSVSGHPHILNDLSNINGNRGDISVSNSGITWVLNSGVINTQHLNSEIIIDCGLIIPPPTGDFDPDAQAYFNRVEGITGDNQTLEAAVKTAINDFVVGCKADGIWNAIKASCILAGARTLNGALQPLVGTAPTSFNFVSGDYNRKTGLAGDRSTKYLDTNWAPTAAYQNNMHLAAYASAIDTTAATQILIGAASPTELWYGGGIGPTQFAFRANDGTGAQNIFTTAAGLYGWSRSDAASKTIRYPSTSVVQSAASIGVSTLAVTVFARSGAILHGGHRLTFFTAGESIDLALLDTRVSALMTALDGAIA